MAKKLEILEAKVGHRRHRPKIHQLLYRVFYVVLPIEKSYSHLPRFFSIDRWNILSIKTQNYTKDKTISLYSYIESIVEKYAVAKEGEWRAELITHPRLFGYSFNPISYWVIYDNSDKCNAVLCAVTNTFRQTHNYFVAHKDLKPIQPNDILKADKDLYVSPFNTMEGYYKFTFASNHKSFKSTVDLYGEDGGLTIETFLSGNRKLASSRTIILVLVKYPFMTVLVIARIHWNAVKLLFKGMHFTMRKHLPKDYDNNETTRST